MIIIKKIKILDTFLAFLLCFPLHNLYKIFPNFITSIISPVNESIWEHMKLFLISLTIISILDYILFKKFKIQYNNLFLNLFLTIMFSIITYLIIFIPVYNNIGENFIFSISLLFIVLLLSQILSYFIYNLSNYKIINKLNILFIIIIYIVFIYLTYNPIYNYLFYDVLNEKYGINYYIN